MKEKVLLYMFVLLILIYVPLCLFIIKSGIDLIIFSRCQNEKTDSNFNKSICERYKDY